MSTGREPIITADGPAWNYIEPSSRGRTMTYTMGSMKGIPTMALFVGQSNDPVFVPLHIMLQCMDWAEQEGELELSCSLYRMLLQENGGWDLLERRSNDG